MRNFVVLEYLGVVVRVLWFGTNGGFAQWARLDVRVGIWFGLGLVCFGYCGITLVGVSPM